MKAMKAGIAVFCEKPLCLNLKEANELVKTSRKLNVPFGVAHTYLGHWTSRLSRYIVTSRAAGRRALGGQLLHPGLAGDQARSHWPAAGRLARRSQARRRFRLRRRHRHARPHATPLRHRPGGQRSSAPSWRPSSRAGSSTTISPSTATSATAPRPWCAPRRFASATRTTSASKSPAPRARLSLAPGRTREPSPSCCRVSRTASIGAAPSRPGDGFLPKDVPADLMAEPTIPSGHPEAFHDAFARLHRCFEADVRKWKAGKAFKCDGAKYANVEDGWMGIAFIETCVKSSRRRAPGRRCRRRSEPVREPEV